MAFRDVIGKDARDVNVSREGRDEIHQHSLRSFTDGGFGLSATDVNKKKRSQNREKSIFCQSTNKHNNFN